MAVKTCKICHAVPFHLCCSDLVYVYKEPFSKNLSIHELTTIIILYKNVKDKNEITVFGKLTYTKA